MILFMRTVSILFVDQVEEVMDNVHGILVDIIRIEYDLIRVRRIFLKVIYYKKRKADC